MMNEKVFVERFVERIEDIKGSLRSNEQPLEALLERVKLGQAQLSKFQFRHEDQCFVSNELFELGIRIEHRIWQRQEQARLEALLESINF